MIEAVIVEALRTPIGHHTGARADVDPADLGHIAHASSPSCTYAAIARIESDLEGHSLGPVGG